MSLLGGEHDFVKAPTDSGMAHWVARCATCRTALWNEHGSRNAIARYVRVGTLDEPNRWPPQAHIYVRSKQPWVILEADTPVFNRHYNAARLWPPESLSRFASARAARAGKKAKAKKRT